MTRLGKAIKRSLARAGHSKECLNLSSSTPKLTVPAFCGMGDGFLFVSILAPSFGDERLLLLTRKRRTPAERSHTLWLVSFFVERLNYSAPCLSTPNPVQLSWKILARLQHDASVDESARSREDKQAGKQRISKSPQTMVGAWRG